MNVAFDSRAAKDPRGIGRYVRSLLSELSRCGRGGIVETYQPHPRTAAVYHSPWLEGALLRSPMPMVVTVHDLIPLKHRGEFLRSGMRLRFRYLAVQRAVRVIVPTHAVAQDAIHQLRIAPERIAVIPEAAAPTFHPRPESEVGEVRKRYGLPQQYLLWVGGLTSPHPHKRVAALAKIKRELPLVLVGPSGRWAQELPGVTLTGQVSDDELAAIYTGAHALVFPSGDEGFGLPPVEALACGTPVAACESPAVSEVLEGRAKLCPLDDLEGLVRAAESATRPAPAPSPWTWEDAARATWDTYDAAYSAVCVPVA